MKSSATVKYSSDGKVKKVWNGAGWQTLHKNGRRWIVPCLWPVKGSCCCGKTAAAHPDFVKRLPQAACPYPEYKPRKGTGGATRVAKEWNGTVQANGVQILQAKPSSVAGWIVVLALRGTEFVVWNMQESNQEFQTGRYFQSDLPAALNCYQEAK